jgi:hypothetical protein
MSAITLDSPLNQLQLLLRILSSCFLIWKYENVRMSHQPRLSYHFGVHYGTPAHNPCKPLLVAVTQPPTTAAQSLSLAVDFSPCHEEKFLLNDSFLDETHGEPNLLRFSV